MKWNAGKSQICRTLVAVTWTGTILAAAAKDLSTVKLRLENTGIDPNAAGTVLSLLKPKASVVKIHGSGLVAGHSYLLTVGETAEVNLVADRNGRVSATFSTKPSRNRPLLDFDPRGEIVAIHDGANRVLQALVSGPGEPSGIVVDERSRMDRLAGTGEAELRYQSLRNGRRFFTVKVERATPGPWRLFVNGIARADFEASGRQTTVGFDSAPTRPTRLPLDFDPRGQVVDLAFGTNLVFTGRLEAHATNVNVATASLVQSFLPSTGADPDGTAKIRYRLDPDARRKFSLELENIPAGAYELFANEVLQGVIHVETTAEGTGGEIEFSNREDDDNGLPLHFDPTTASFSVRSAGVVYFEGKLAGEGTGGGNVSGGIAPDSFAGLTLNLDDQPGGDLMRFDTETSGVDLGDNPDPFVYTLTRLNGSQVRLDLTDGDKLDVYIFAFVSTNAGTWSRDEYRDGSLKDRDAGPFTIVAGTIPGGDPGSSGSTSNLVIFPERIEVPLFNLGALPGASATATFKRDDRGRESFEVEIEDAPAGSYTLWVGAERSGDITVLPGTDGRGRIQFENEDGTSTPLSFNPLGRVLTIARDGTNYFQRVFPSDN